MKRAAMLLLCWMTFAARAEEAALYPIWGNGLWGLMKVSRDGAEYLTEPRYESHVGGVITAKSLEHRIDFSEGLHPVRVNGQWGYIDERAEWAIRPAWDLAGSFRDGLALVEKDGKLAYIDHAGATVWQEQ